MKLPVPTITVRRNWPQASCMTVFLLTCGNSLSEPVTEAFHQKLAQRIQIFVFVEPVEQAEGALVETLAYPHVHRLDPINIPVRSL